ncbi:hypothetical protein BKA82DRAFT_1008889 [Pisolithus tinctorius]|uniref:Prolyl 4-hydroxylase alpha subunit Fe(2+) 2OG dioxygenase domain-containing protein n=1 Tax=Pisolithus tinctorius Marx 270 TaxID=870435 RepID=A0A0C3NM93_PISTI|nr:hypothetical protein BKA82DRAFT_1008889 [Pisolithus tinctorius]KIN93507.1 hypothetical protein M404DRAFT_1008889 [Pisolithus tinctorius Marx 270]KIN96408.1 hypothetical protein M404DRAFT_1006797 [Pisolithus tinctorius Marx 270]
MIGSLVIVFPTPHEGGELVLRKNDHERVVDFAKSMSESSQQPFVGYVSFFSDVEHEARVVTSCHRVTLTYNSYFIRETDPLPLTLSTSSLHDQTLAEAVYKLMTNNHVLPSGGYLGIGLCRQNLVTDSGYRCHRFPQLSEKPRCCTWLCFIRFWRVLERPCVLSLCRF